MRRDIFWTLYNGTTGVESVGSGTSREEHISTALSSGQRLKRDRREGKDGTPAILSRSRCVRRGKESRGMSRAL